MSVNIPQQVAIRGLLSVFLLKKSEKANEHIARHFLQLPKKSLPPMLRMNGQRPQMKGHVEKCFFGRATNVENEWSKATK